MWGKGRKLHSALNFLNCFLWSRNTDLDADNISRNCVSPSKLLTAPSTFHSWLIYQTHTKVDILTPTAFESMLKIYRIFLATNVKEQFYALQWYESGHLYGLISRNIALFSGTSFCSNLLGLRSAQKVWRMSTSVHSPSQDHKICLKTYFSGYFSIHCPYGRQST